MKKAFTMLELVFVIVIVGILSFIAASSFQRNTLREAADQVVSHIRYTQHLAMTDDKFDPNEAQWFMRRWTLRFQQNVGFGGVGSSPLPPISFSILSKYPATSFICSCSFIAAWFVFSAASFAFAIIPFSLNTRLIVIPANINNTTIVTTNAIRVIPLSPLNFLF